MSGFKDFDQTTPGNNASVGSINFKEGQVPSSVNDSLRQFAGDLRLGIAGAEFSANSATTVDLSLIESNNVLVAGTTQVENFGVQSAGIEKNLRFNNTLTIKHSAGAITCPGGSNMTCFSGDLITVRSEGSGHWRVIQDERGGVETFTPTLAFATAGDWSATYATQIGTATRTRDEVNASFVVSTKSAGGATHSGALLLSGLPYSASSVTAAGFSYRGPISFSGISVTSITQMTSAVEIGSAQVHFEIANSGSALADLGAGDGFGTVFTLIGEIRYKV